ncbi:MAG: TIGR02449 family protein [Gammaproteobacteria bacterium]|nr:TIGR02449 family protein [Gammaproteobacteria bacterium]MDA8007976.1 TIGR02449 family protein [Gammaproteobacteria bacterium]
MNSTIEKLEQRVSDLIQLTEEIRRENETLRGDQRLLRQEYKSLQEKNRIASGRVEQIVSRLKALQA